MKCGLAPTLRGLSEVFEGGVFLAKRCPNGLKASEIPMLLQHFCCTYPTLGVKIVCK